MSFSFQLKSKKKTSFQKQKETEEERRKRDNDEAAKVYEDFVKDFGDDDDDADDLQGPTKEVQITAVASGGSSAPKRHYVSHTSTHTPKESLSNNAINKPRKLDLFLENLKKEQAEREQQRQFAPTSSGQEPDRLANDAHDQASTNLFINNLAPDIDESMLLREFGRFGPIGSVKVMWPRDEEQRRRGKNNGFVAFMKREDAEKARDALDGVMLRDFQLSLGWGKSVPLPPVPIWPLAPQTGGQAANAMNAHMLPLPPESSRQRMHDGPPPKQQVVGFGPDIEVIIPEDSRLRFVIDAMAFYVLRDGCDFEQAIMKREANNPEFSFLFDVSSPGHSYYRWRLYSLANGDTLRSWRVDPFLMIDKSNRWVPPPMTLVASTHKSGAERGGTDDGSQLSELSKEKLLNMLENLTVDRDSICDAMVFVLDHAECASEVTDILISTFTTEGSIPMHIAKLFLLSDILHNTAIAVRNASRYRARLQDALPDVFESMQELHRKAESRIAQELLKKHVLKVLRVWRGWYMFTDDFLNGLQCTFLKSGLNPAGTKTMPSEDEIDTTNSKYSELTDDELQLRCKHAGLSRKGGRRSLIARLMILDIYLHADKQVAPVAQQAQGIREPKTSGWQEVTDSGHDDSGPSLKKQKL